MFIAASVADLYLRSPRLACFVHCNKEHSVAARNVFSYARNPYAWPLFALNNGDLFAVLHAYKCKIKTFFHISESCLFLHVNVAVIL